MRALPAYLYFTIKPRFMNQQEYVQQAIRDHKRKQRKLTLITIAAVGIPVLIMIFSLNSKNTKEVERPLTKEEKIQQQFSSWDGSHRNVTDAIKRSMNDPDSYEHVETVYWILDDKIVVKTTFRGNNAFGAKVLNTIRSEVSLSGDVLKMTQE